ncbi:hypothetical protein FQA39_LY09386 [Lamprigera yunnana]|nr:hypothetical protein FQA39_LY09386 [Lamprigera yunnana]
MNRECFEDDENWWERRSGMERCMFVFLIIAVTFSIGCVTFIILHYLLMEEVCTSNVCLREALRISSNLHKGLDLCDDYSEFVSKMQNKDIDFQDIVKNEINQLVQQPIEEDEAMALKKEKQLFQVCVTENATDTSFDIVQDMLNEIGGWPVVVGYRWRARLFEWTDAVYILRSRGYPFSIFLTTSLIDNKIVISNPIATPPKFNPELYTNLMIDIAVIFGADRYQAQLRMPEVVDFYEELINVTKENIENKNKSEELFSTELSVDELQKLYDEIQWLDFFSNVLYPITTITGRDKVIIPSHDYLEAIFDLISATSKRVQANYLIWRVIEEMIPFMSKELQNLQRNYTCQTGLLPLQIRAELCTDFLDSVYYIRPSQVSYLHSQSRVEYEEDIHEMIANVRSELIAFLEECEIDVESLQSSREFLDSINLIIGTPENVFNETIFDEVSSSDDSTDFLQMVLNVRKNYVDTFYLLQYGSDNSSDTFDLLKCFNATYSKLSNTLLIPSMVLQEFFKENRPMYLNYANLGIIIGKELSKALFLNAEEFWSNGTIEILKESIWTEINIEVMLQYMGTKVAYTAYQKWVEDNTKEPKLVGLNHTPNQLFWISALSNSKQLYLNETIFVNENFVNDFECSKF